MKCAANEHWCMGVGVHAGTFQIFVCLFYMYVRMDSNLKEITCHRLLNYHLLSSFVPIDRVRTFSELVCYVSFDPPSLLFLENFVSFYCCIEV